MSCRDGQTDRQRGPALCVGPLGIRHSVHHQYQEERDDGLHYDTLGYRHAVAQRGGAQATASDLFVGYYQLDRERCDLIKRGGEKLVIAIYDKFLKK